MALPPQLGKRQQHLARQHAYACAAAAPPHHSCATCAGDARELGKDQGLKRRMEAGKSILTVGHNPWAHHVLYGLFMLVQWQLRQPAGHPQPAARASLQGQSGWMGGS